MLQVAIVVPLHATFRGGCSLNRGGQVQPVQFELMPLSTRGLSSSAIRMARVRRATRMAAQTAKKTLYFGAKGRLSTEPPGEDAHDEMRRGNEGGVRFLSNRAGGVLANARRGRGGGRGVDSGERWWARRRSGQVVPLWSQLRGHAGRAGAGERRTRRDAGPGDARDAGGPDERHRRDIGVVDQRLGGVDATGLGAEPQVRVTVPSSFGSTPFTRGVPPSSLDSSAGESVRAIHPPPSTRAPADPSE